MNAPSLHEKLSLLLNWERLKRRETVALSALCCSFLLSLISLPAAPWLSAWVHSWAVPALVFFLVAPALFLLRRWRPSDSLRAVWQLDRALGMEERALTAWEVLGRRNVAAAEWLVLQEAEKKLKGVDPRTLFKRQLGWRAVAAPALMLAWLLSLFLDGGSYPDRTSKAGAPSGAAAQLKEFARGLQERAMSQGLSQSLEVARALERLAAERMADEVDDRGLKQSVAGWAEKLRAAEAGGAEALDVSFPMATTEGLSDLKAELEALRAALPSEKGQDSRLRAALERLGGLPRLKGEIGKRAPSFDKLDMEALQSLLETLEKQLATEMDRRTLADAREFLEQLLTGMESEQERAMIAQGKALEQGRSPASERDRRKGIFPGDQPGTKGEAEEPPLPSRASAGVHLKGLLGEGKGASLSFRGQAKAGSSRLSQEEILAAYSRQAEEELASERIPEGLREAVRKYFLSLGMVEK